MFADIKQQHTLYMHTCDLKSCSTSSAPGIILLPSHRVPEIQNTIQVLSKHPRLPCVHLPRSDKYLLSRRVTTLSHHPSQIRRPRSAAGELVYHPRLLWAFWLWLDQNSSQRLRRCLETRQAVITGELNEARTMLRLAWVIEFCSSILIQLLLTRKSSKPYV